MYCVTCVLYHRFLSAKLGWNRIELNRDYKSLLGDTILELKTYKLTSSSRFDVIVADLDSTDTKIDNSETEITIDYNTAKVFNIKSSCNSDTVLDTIPNSTGVWQFNFTNASQLQITLNQSPLLTYVYSSNCSGKYLKSRMKVVKFREKTQGVLIGFRSLHLGIIIPFSTNLSSDSK